MLDGALAVPLPADPPLTLEARYRDGEARATVAVVARGDGQRLSRCELRLSADGRMLEVDDLGHTEVMRPVGQDATVSVESLRIALPLRGLEQLQEAKRVEITVCLKSYDLDRAASEEVRSFAVDAIQRSPRRSLLGGL